MADRRPPGWNHWAEVVWNEPRMPKFIGDMPHGWVGSDFLRSFLDLFAYEGAGGSLVLGAGHSAVLAPRGGRRRASGGCARRTARSTSPSRRRAPTCAFRIGGTAKPPGGFVAEWPLRGPARPTSSSTAAPSRALCPAA